jgi:hypothetical protein
MGGNVTKSRKFDAFDYATYGNSIRTAKYPDDIYYIHSLLWQGRNKNAYTDTIKCIKDINAMNCDRSIIKEYLNYSDISIEDIMKFIDVLQSKGYDFNAEINTGWLDILLIKIDVEQDFSYLYRYYYRDCKILGYIKIFIELHKKNAKIDLTKFTEEEILKVLRVVDETLITNLELFRLLIERVVNKTQFVDKIKFINAKIILVTVNYDGFTDEEKNLAIELGKWDINLINGIGNISDNARDIIIAKDYTLLNYNKPNFSDKFILHAFAKNNNIKMFTNYNDKFDINEKDDNGDTPAMIASKKGYIDILQIIQAHRNKQ